MIKEEPLHAAAADSTSWNAAEFCTKLLEAIKASQPDAEYLSVNNIDVPDGEYERFILRRKDLNGHTALHLAVNKAELI